MIFVPNDTTNEQEVKKTNFKILIFYKKITSANISNHHSIYIKIIFCIKKNRFFAQLYLNTN